MSNWFTCFIAAGFWTSLVSRVDYFCGLQWEKCGAWISACQTSNIFPRASTISQVKHCLPCESLAHCHIIWLQQFSFILSGTVYFSIWRHWWLLVVCECWCFLFLLLRLYYRSCLTVKDTCRSSYVFAEVVVLFQCCYCASNPPMTNRKGRGITSTSNYFFQFRLIYEWIF
jgi:hypothetical protein